MNWFMPQPIRWSGGSPPHLRDNQEMYQNGHLTERGFAEMQKAMEGQNITFTTADGRQTMNVGMDGSVVNSTEQGVVASGDKARAETLKDELKAGGFGKNAVAEVDSMMKSGKGFSYEFAKDRNGNIESFSINRGGDVGRKDMATFRTGRNAESVNRNVQTVDQGLRSTVGNQTWRGNRGISDNFHQDTYTDARGTHSRYSWTDKAGHKHIASGSDDGLIHMQVQNEGKVANLTVDPASGQVLLENTSSGKKDVLFADRTEIQQGTHVTGAANMAASKIVSLTGVDQKTAEGVIATVQSIAGDVVPLTRELGGAIKSSRSATQGAEEKAAREVAQAARDKTEQVKLSSQKTARVLQKQSRNSNLPKSGGPAPHRR